jgi:hypothetical protein
LKRSVYIGWELREAAAYAVTRASIQRHLSAPIEVHGLVLEHLQEAGLYTRPIKRFTGAQDNRMIDVISDAPMATSFACSRFLVPHLAETGWAMFVDCDFLFRADLGALFDSLDPAKAVYCVQHDFRPREGLKMDSQFQTNYERKLWSSLMIFNCEHPANKTLTLDLINSVPGRDLHRFCWLKDEDLGELGEEWNWVPDFSPEEIEPKAVHFTLGGPWFRAYEDAAFADEWRAECLRWAA